jgi:hypothetical protein
VSTTEDILGRADVNDVDGILAVANTDVDEVDADAIFTWDYSLSRPALRKLYEKAKTGQWNATTDIPWDTDVDLEKTIVEDAMLNPQIDASLYADTPIAHWGEKEWIEFGMEARRWTLSQFMHGEQGALLCTAKITETVPWYDAKLYASRWSTRPATWRCSPATSTRSWAARTRSTRTCGPCSTTSSTTPGGT